MIIHTTTKGQIIIPAVLRRKFGITKETEIFITDNGEEIILRPLARDRINKLRGSLKGKGSIGLLLEERQKDKDREDEDL